LPSLVLFAGKFSVLGAAVATKLAALDPAKVSVYQVDIDTTDGAEIAMRLSIREAPFVILFVAGISKLSANNLTDAMIQAVK
jgi:thioredoxin-like negative regulator of GroEL